MQQSSSPVNTVLIIARSARMLAEAARRSGWRPWVIDLFGDLDTRAAAARWACLRPAAHYGFDRRLLELVGAWCAHNPDLPIVLGSGFEHTPRLMVGLARLGQLCGVQPAAVQALKSVPETFARLADSGSVLVPATTFDSPPDRSGWLIKRGGMSGGFHVVAARRQLRRGEYYQRRISGQVISALFLAGGGQLHLAGMFRQLSWQQGAAAGHHYQGAITWNTAPQAVLDACQRVGAVVAAMFSLTGLFGLDFVWRDGIGPVLIDINPRPPATLDLLADAGELFAAHLVACAARPLLYSRPRASGESGQLLLYAARQWQIPARFRWPHGVADRPAAGQLISRGAPLCTVRAAAVDGPTAIARLANSARELGDTMGAAAAAVLPSEFTISTVGGAEHVRTES